MSTHSLLSPSSAHRWMACPGSMSFPENREQGESNSYADDGTATHAWASEALTVGWSPVGSTRFVNGTEYTLDEERAARIQGYIDYVRQHAIGGHLFVEVKVDLSDTLGSGEGGTADAAIAIPHSRSAAIIDLKDGSGEKVFASYCIEPATDTTPEIREPNPQLAFYALGMLPSLELFGPVDSVTLAIYQPKLNHIDEYPISIEDLRAFGERAELAAEKARVAANARASHLISEYFQPGAKQCRWCRAKTRCQALEKFIADEVRADFETIAATGATIPAKSTDLATAYVAVPLIEQWCVAVKAEMQRRVADGESIIGPDGKPYKYVEGKEGARKWRDEKTAEEALLGQLPREKVYTEPKVITAPVAAKLLNKKATAALWTDIFEPLISRPRGQPILVMGSDDRPAFTGVAKTDDFQDELSQ